MKMRHRIRTLLKQPIFWFVTIFGNGLILLGSFGFYYVEMGKNPALTSFLDSLSWSVGIVTTIGYGTVTPVTTSGKILGIFMMMGGCIFLWSYMALFVSALIAPDLVYLEKEVREIESDISKIRSTR